MEDNLLIYLDCLRTLQSSRVLISGASFDKDKVPLTRRLAENILGLHSWLSGVIKTYMRGSFPQAKKLLSFFKQFTLASQGKNKKAVFWNYWFLSLTINIISVMRKDHHDSFYYHFSLNRRGYETLIIYIIIVHRLIFYSLMHFGPENYENY